MGQRRSIHDKLFRAIVVMGAAMGAAACDDEGKGPPDAPPGGDAQVADASIDGSPGDAPVDTVAIL